MDTKTLDKNKKSWDSVAHHFNGVDALPNYGPFSETEEELQLFEKIKGARVLEIGYGSGHSLKYMAERGAEELWGVDLSDAQKAAAEKTLAGLEPHLYAAPMEKEIGLPASYFDCVFSIYAIGWTTNLSHTFELIHSYLKPGGTFIFSWDHPLYQHLSTEQGKFQLTGSYQNEGPAVMKNFKEDGVDLVIHKRKMSTYINALIEAGFIIKKVIESDILEKDRNTKPKISSRYYSLYKARRFPATMIIKAVKPS